MKLQRIGGIGGIVGAALLLAGGLSQGTSVPEVDSPAEQITAFFAANEDTFRFALPLILLGFTAIGFFLLALFDRLRSGGAGGWAYAVLIGGAADGALSAISVALFGTIALEPGGGLAEAQIVALYGLQSAVYAATPTFDIILLLGTAIPAVAPSWFRGSSLLLAGLGVVSVFGVSNAPIGAAALIYSLLFFVWIVVGSVWLLRGDTTAVGDTAAPTPATDPAV